MVEKVKNRKIYLKRVYGLLNDCMWLRKPKVTPNASSEWEIHLQQLKADFSPTLQRLAPEYFRINFSWPWSSHCLSYQIQSNMWNSKSGNLRGEAWQVEGFALRFEMRGMLELTHLGHLLLQQQHNGNINGDNDEDNGGTGGETWVSDGRKLPALCIIITTVVKANISSSPSLAAWYYQRP